MGSSVLTVRRTRYVLLTTTTVQLPVMIKNSYECNILAVMSQGGQPTCLSTSSSNSTSSSSTTTSSSTTSWSSKKGWLPNFSFSNSSYPTTPSSTPSPGTPTSFFSSFTSNNENSENMGRDCNVWIPQSL